MATAAVTTVEPSAMECTICHEHFTLPKILPCGHLLCRHCLVTWLHSQPEANCPLCRCEIVDPKQHRGKSFEDITDGFPSDLAMAALVEADGVLSKQHACCVCVNKAAVDICVNCSDMFCASCSHVHKKSSMSKLHKVESLSSLTAETLAANRPATCDVHDDEVSKLYCPTHGVSICLFCATADHRQCPDVTKLESKMAEARSVLADLAAMLSRGEKELEEAIAGLDKDLQEIDQRTQATVAEIQAACDGLEESVKACRRRLTELTFSTSRDVKNNVSHRKTVLVQRKGKATTHRIIVQRAEGFPTLASLLKMALQMKPRIHGLDLSTTVRLDVKDISMVTLTVDPQAVSRVEQELAKLGLKPVPCVFCFHDNHGKKIMLSNNNQTAQRTSSDRYDGIVMSRDPMVPGMLYQVEINDINKKWGGTFLGVVTNSPDTFALPDTFWRSHPAVLCVGPNRVSVFGVEKEKVRLVLDKLAAGSKVGLAVHSDTSLHLYVDGKHHGVVAPDIPSPCYFMFELYAYCTKVTALPVTPVP